MLPNADTGRTSQEGTGGLYIPAEIGSRLARAALRVGELEARLHASEMKRTRERDVLEAALRHHQQLFAEAQGQLNRIHASHGWKVLTWYYRGRQEAQSGGQALGRWGRPAAPRR
jgi:hypothetical protein